MGKHLINIKVLHRNEVLSEVLLLLKEEIKQGDKLNFVQKSEPKV